MPLIEPFGSAKHAPTLPHGDDERFFAESSIALRCDDAGLLMGNPDVISLAVDEISEHHSRVPLPRDMADLSFAYMAGLRETMPVQADAVPVWPLTSKKPRHPRTRARVSPAGLDADYADSADSDTAQPSHGHTEEAVVVSNTIDYHKVGEIFMKFGKPHWKNFPPIAGRVLGRFTPMKLWHDWCALDEQSPEAFAAFKRTRRKAIIHRQTYGKSDYHAWARYLQDHGRPFGNKSHFVNGKLVPGKTLLNAWDLWESLEVQTIDAFVEKRLRKAPRMYTKQVYSEADYRGWADLFETHGLLSGNTTYAINGKQVSGKTLQNNYALYLQLDEQSADAFCALKMRKTLIYTADDHRAMARFFEAGHEKLNKIKPHVINGKFIPAGTMKICSAVWQNLPEKSVDEYVRARMRKKAPLQSYTDDDYYAWGAYFLTLTNRCGDGKPKLLNNKNVPARTLAYNYNLFAALPIKTPEAFAHMRRSKRAQHAAASPHETEDN